MLESHVTALLNPISASHPSGELIRYTPAYDAIQEARLLDDETTLPEGVWQADSKHSDWKKVVDLSVKALTKQSKDIQIIAWLIEALFFLEELPGLNQGLEILQELSKKFWDTLYPLPEEGDLEARFVPYEWLDYQLPIDLLSTPVTQPLHKELPVYKLADWIDASHLDLLSRKQKNPEGFLTQEGRPLLSEVIASVKKTPHTFYEKLENQVQNTLNLLRSIEEIVSEKAKQEVSLFYHLKEKMKALLTSTHSWKNQSFKLASQDSMPPLESDEKPLPQSSDVTLKKKNAPGDSDNVTQKEKSSHSFGTDSLTSREEAYALLRRITDFLLAEDPHSPTPYLLRQTLGWIDKSLPDIYAEFAQDPQALLLFMRLLGVKGEG